MILVIRQKPETRMFEEISDKKFKRFKKCRCCQKMYEIDKDNKWYCKRCLKLLKR